MAVPANSIALTGSDQTVRTGISVYRGFVVRETAGAAASARVYDGTDNTGTLIDVISLAPNESAREYYGEGGLWCATGIYVDILAGTIEGSVRVG
jgi:hypothetical protein